MSDCMGISRAIHEREFPRPISVFRKCCRTMCKRQLAKWNWDNPRSEIWLWWINRLIESLITKNSIDSGKGEVLVINLTISNDSLRLSRLAKSQWRSIEAWKWIYFCTQLNYSEAMTLYTTISRIDLVIKLLLLLLHKSKCKSQSKFTLI